MTKDCGREWEEEAGLPGCGKENGMLVTVLIDIPGRGAGIIVAV